MSHVKCRCRTALLIFTIVDDDGHERCIDCGRVIRPAAMTL